MTETPVYGAWDYVAEDDEAEPDWVVDYEDHSHPVEYIQPAEVREYLSHSYEDFLRQMAVKGFERDSLIDGVEKVYSTAQAAEFFGRTAQWVYWGLRDTDPVTKEPITPIFLYEDGSPILPDRVGKMAKRRFTLPLIREIAYSCYRRGQFNLTELEEVMAKILLAQYGRKAFADSPTPDASTDDVSV